MGECSFGVPSFSTPTHHRFSGRFHYDLVSPAFKQNMTFSFGLFWTSVVCCLIAQLFIVRSVLGARHLPNPEANVPRSRGVVELFWAVIPAVALAVLLVFTWRAIQERQAVHSPIAELAR
jgi:heme/copper-type cytochrome/quinol oxidase subunit 2